mmetsp:Transcript_126447/g.282616  ORF Transcript_126447/g.282616 Transcript_126447/m.282616 type:complete len:938 (-) Transcript_126447:145-2958(-)
MLAERDCTQLAWLWEDRPDELVRGRPRHCLPKGAVIKLLPPDLDRPAGLLQAHEDLTAALGGLPPPSSSPSRRSPEYRASHAGGQSPPAPSGPDTSVEGHRGRVAVAASSSPQKVALPPPGVAKRGPKRRHIIGQAASRLTLAQVVSPRAPDSERVWRGLGLPRSLERGRREALEFARYRHHHFLECSALDRARAARWMARRFSVANAPDNENLGDTRILAQDLSRDEAAQHNPRHTSGGRDSSRASSALGIRDEGVAGEDVVLGGSVNHSLSTTATSASTPAYARSKSGLTDEAPSEKCSQTVVELPPLEEDAQNVNALDRSMEEKMMSVSSSVLRGSVAPVPSKSSVLQNESGASKKTAIQSSPSSRLSSPSREEIPAMTSRLPGGSRPGSLTPGRPGSLTPEMGLVTTHGTGQNRTGVRTSVRSLRGKGAHTGKKHWMKMGRMAALLQARRNWFEGWPAHERERLKRAFAAGDRTGKAGLDVIGLRVALSELGYEGHTREEKNAIGAVMKAAIVGGTVNFFDFVFQLIPLVDQKLHELRSPILWSEFSSADPHGKGHIHPEECLECLKALGMHGCCILEEDAIDCFWKAYVREFNQTIVSVRLTDGSIDFPGFQELCSDFEVKRAEFLHKCEKRVAMATALPAVVEARHTGELTYLKSVWDMYRGDEENVDFCRCVLALLRSGALPIAGDIFDQMLNLFSEHAHEDKTTFCFGDFLKILHAFREEETSQRRSAIQALLNSPGWSSTTQIISDDVPELICELGSCMESCTSLAQISTIFEVCNKEISEYIDFTELVPLVGRVTECSRAMARRVEGSIAETLGFKPEEIFELRVAYAGLSPTGVLSIQAVKEYLHQLNPSVTILDKEVEALMGEVSSTIDSTSGRIADVVQQTLQVSEPDRQMLEEFMERRSRGENLTCVLRFDGFLRLAGLLLAD